MPGRKTSVTSIGESRDAESAVMPEATMLDLKVLVPSAKPAREVGARDVRLLAQQRFRGGSRRLEQIEVGRASCRERVCLLV